MTNPAVFGNENKAIESSKYVYFLFFDFINKK